MCGIAGFLGPWPFKSSPLNGLESMGQTLIHRGPDDGGTWLHPKAHVGFVHRRLSILDLSSDGHQPKTSTKGRYTITYNGEIYNYQSLRQELGEVHGMSDTAVLLAALEAYGVAATLPKLCGMFAFAVWDHLEQELWLVRDQIGIKPLYYGDIQGTFFFASELRAFSTLNTQGLDIQNSSVGLLLRHNAIGSHHTIYKNIHKCLPGHCIRLKKNEDPRIECWWSPRTVATKALQTPFVGSEAEAMDQLEANLTQSVKAHMASDVPLGAFLSGGIDSSLVCALAQKSGDGKLKTFTIGMKDDNYNEAEHASAIAQHLQTDHHELYLDPLSMALEVPDLLSHCDEPFADSSLIPTACVSRMTRQHVTVSLSGDGGDELFCGYPRYRWTENIWEKLSYIPEPCRAWLKFFILKIPPQQWSRFFSSIKFLWDPNEVNMGQKMHRLARILNSTSTKDLYSKITSHFDDPSPWMKDYQTAFSHLHSEEISSISKNAKEQMMFSDFVSYLPDDILTKLDRASMQFSLEARVPMLTPELFSFAWSLPLKWRNNKTILKKVLYRHLPESMMERPKMGFGVPLGDWLRGPLRSWAEDLLSEELLKRSDHFQGPAIRKMWLEHLGGRYNWQYHLWDILCFQHWFHHVYRK